MLGYVSFIRMVQKATYFGCHWFVLCIKTKQRVELPIQTWGLLFSDALEESDPESGTILALRSAI